MSILILIIALSINPFSNVEIETLSTTFEEAYFQPNDQDRKMSLGSNELGEVCFSCHLPGSECYTYPATCFKGSSW